MNKEEIIKDSDQIVNRLIMQYKEYMRLLNKIKNKDKELLEAIATAGKRLGKIPSELLQDNYKDSDTKAINKEKDLLKIDLDQISDEMTFANPIIWMMYKYKAYKGASNEISNMRQFRNHCTPKGYICTERYIFLNQYLKENQDTSLSDTERFPDDMDLSEVYESDLMISIYEDLEFMTHWKGLEYLKTDGKINKWKTVV